MAAKFDFLLEIADFVSNHQIFVGLIEPFWFCYENIHKQFVRALLLTKTISERLSSWNLNNQQNANDYMIQSNGAYGSSECLRSWPESLCNRMCHSFTFIPAFFPLTQFSIPIDVCSFHLLHVSIWWFKCPIEINSILNVGRKQYIHDNDIFGKCKFFTLPMVPFTYSTSAWKGVVISWIY